MADYWLDTNVFITPKNTFYAFDFAPGYWTFIEQQGEQGVLAASMMVYDELAGDQNDELSEWVRAHRECGLFVQLDDAVQTQMGNVADHVQGIYETQHVERFLSGADPWVIAHALNDGGQVVTFENKKRPSKIKIPNVCDALDVGCTDLYDMLRALGFALA